MKRLGVERATIAGILTAWNLRNDPPLFRPELSNLIEVAYNDQAYEFDCEMLLEILPDGACKGRNNCLYIDLLLELGMRDVRRSGKSSKRAKRQNYPGQKKEAEGREGKGTASRQGMLFS